VLPRLAENAVVVSEFARPASAVAGQFRVRSACRRLRKEPVGAQVVPGPRFVWAPEPGAAGYRFALYRDERLLFDRDVTKPALVLASTWTHDGRFHQLTRGTYRWVVWAKPDPVLGRAGVGARRYRNGAVPATLPHTGG
jgi:hypothetical protein